MFYKSIIFTLSAAVGLSLSGCSSSGNDVSSTRNGDTANVTTSAVNANSVPVTNSNSAANPTPVNESASNKDSKVFLIKAAQDGAAEVQVCELALKQSGSTDVKKFAQDMIMQHGQANQEAARIAAQKNITLPAEVSAEQKSTFEEMKKLSGKNFDKKFMEHNVSDHTKDVKDFKEQMEQGTDADIKAFAAKTLTMLQTHLGYSTEINNKIKS